MRIEKLISVLMAGLLAVESFQSPVLAKSADEIPRNLMNETMNLNTIDFSEDFGEGDDQSIDTQIWHPLIDGSIMNRKKDPTIAEGQAGRGYGFYTDGKEKSFIEHTFDNYIRGKVSVDFYDDETNIEGRMAQVNLTGIGNEKNSDKPFTIGLGINQNKATNGFSNANYVARIADDGRYLVTEIKRTEGWHTFVLECGEEGTSLWIDEIEVDTSSIPEKDIVTAFKNIQIGDKWAKGGETYFDNIKLENMAIVDMGAEEAAKKDASLKTIKVNGFKIPGISSEKTEYIWEWEDLSDLPEITVETTNPKAKAEVTQATFETKIATVKVTAADGITVMNYTITFNEIKQIEQEWHSSFEGENPLAGWETLDERGRYTEISSEQAHEGSNSFLTRGANDKKSWIFKKFDRPVNGKASVWFYDTMGENGRESFQQVNIWAPFDNVNEQPAIVGLGTQSGVNAYSIRSGTASGYIVSTVKRAKGWHEFTFDVTSGNDATFSIDGEKVYTTTALSSIGALQMGDKPFKAEEKLIQSFLILVGDIKERLQIMDGILCSLSNQNDMRIGLLFSFLTDFLGNSRVICLIIDKKELVIIEISIILVYHCFCIAFQDTHLHVPSFRFVFPL